MYIDKDEMWGYLGADAIGFATWLNSTTDPDAINIKNMLENSNGITIDSPLILNQIVPLLRSKGVFSQTTVDRLNTIVAYEKSRPHRYVVPRPYPVPENWFDWLKPYCDYNFTIQISEDFVYIETKGVCTIPGVELV